MTKWYEVRRETSVGDEEFEGVGVVPTQDFVIESCRLDKKAAEQDVELLKACGKKTWIVEIER